MKRVAVIDIGSNSVRLGIYGAVGSALISLYDEKATCGLGKNLSATGKLYPGGVNTAIVELQRFADLVSDSPLEGFYPFATAAVRDALDGEEFVQRVAAETGVTIQIISGLEEARYSAMGVAGAIPGATGIVGDLGGGSLELVRLENGTVADQTTLPIGALLRPLETDADATRDWLRQKLEPVSWLAACPGSDFYLVGGAWRAFARAHMRQSGHPLPIIHEYSMRADDAVEVAELIGLMGERSLSLLTCVPRKRRPIMPYASLMLAEIARIAKPANIVASSHGLREGFVREVLKLGGSDPFLDYCRHAGAANARIAPDGGEVFEWLVPLFPDLQAETRRWVEGACWLSDLAGRDHPDRRAEIAFARGSNLPAVAFSHEGRAFMGTALKVRYNGARRFAAEDEAAAQHLLTDKEIEMAVRLGCVLRLAHAVSPSGRSLAKTALTLDAESVTLDGPAGLLSGETVTRRFRNAAEIFGKRPVLLGQTPAR